MIIFECNTKDTAYFVQMIYFMVSWMPYENNIVVTVNYVTKKGIYFTLVILVSIVFQCNI